MATFRYRAKSRRGEILSGRVEAANSKLAQEVLEERNLQIILLQPLRGGIRIPIFKERVKARDIVIFFRQLSTLAGANVPLVRALRTLCEQTVNSELKRVLVQVSDEVEAGTKLSLAFSKHPHIFSSFFISMVKSGETAGRLSEVLNYLADQTEKEYDLVAKVRGAMMYPAFIVAGMIIVGIIMLIFVIPQLTAVLIESGAKLPLTTRMLIGTSEITKHYWWLMLIVLIAGGVLFHLALRRPPFRARFDKFKLRVPFVGSIFQKIAIARLTRSLQILLSGGVDLVGALDVVAQVVGNAYYKELIDETKREVADGNSVTAVLEQSPLIPPMVSQMLAVGEESGQFTSVLEKLTSFYTREVDNAVSTLVSVIEPLLMVIIGLGVGVVVASIILPMYQLAGQF